ncbi:MAG: hypothetical protein Unbinned6284contig1004_50 [Prokaryotic dsDNA virus sp.]|nr:MAG: hypothetical protein Unbinned6284contig1004_50 [Prokaryotic dsDNA virus sp.]|tara:strand:+ start:8460 stop:8981 length:522 start_codon:yes stop_codon:yes gene_type:complete
MAVSSLGRVFETGRPPKYKTPEELRKKVVDYFENCPRKKYITIYKYSEEDDKMMPEVVEKPHYTKSGLCSYLGFGDFTSLYDYEKKEERAGDKATEEDKQFSHILKMATMIITDEYESMLINKSTATGAMFALKNMKSSSFNDRTDVTSGDEPLKQSVAIVPDRKSADDWGKE